MIIPAAGEPQVDRWQSMTMARLAAGISEATDGNRYVLAIDGRSAGGKTTLAHRLNRELPTAVVVSTDDLAWQESMFDWADLLIEGVLRPFREGGAVTYRPPAWDRHKRTGSIDIPGGAQILILEGVGASRAEFTTWLDQTLWIQSDQAEAERRGIARDIASGVNGDAPSTIAFWQAWQAEELVFMTHDRPWERADLLVAGTAPGTANETDLQIAEQPQNS